MNYTGQNFIMILFAMTAQKKSSTVKRRTISMINNLVQGEKLTYKILTEEDQNDF